MDNVGKTGAVCGSDRDQYSYTSLPLLGLLAAARVGVEGKSKYGRLNYKQGTPSHEHIDHALHHIVMDQLGDRDEPNLEHALWRIMAAIESRILHPELNEGHDLGPGATITPAVKAHLDAEAPDLAARRKAGEFAGIGNWKLTDLTDVKRLLDQRHAEMTKGEAIFSNGDDDKLVQEMKEFLGNVASGEPLVIPRKEDSQIPIEPVPYAVGDGSPEDLGIYAEAAIQVAKEDAARPTIDKFEYNLALSDEQAEAVRTGLEQRLKVGKYDAPEPELKPETIEERGARICRRLKVDKLTQAIEAELKEAAGFYVPSWSGVSVRRYRPGKANGELELIGDVIEFPDGSVFDRFKSEAVKPVVREWHEANQSGEPRVGPSPKATQFTSDEPMCG